MATLHRARPMLQGQPVIISRTAAVARLLRRFSAGHLIALVFLMVVGVVAVVPQLIARYDPIEIIPESILMAPHLAHPFGTDQFGRDILSRVAFGARVSLGFASGVTLISVSLSTLIGTLVGYRQGRLDSLVMRIIDVFMAFPGILLALVVISLLGPGLVAAMFAVGLGQTPAFIRIVRSATLAIQHEVYVEAARAVGASDLRILHRHIFPNVMHTILVLSTLGFGAAILIGSSLSFLGLGAQPPTPEWGSMLGSARHYFRTSWWVPTLPGAILAATLLSVNMIGDQLRDIFDPRLRVA